MNTATSRFLAAVCGLITAAASLTAAQPLQELDTYFQIQDGQVMLVKGGKPSPLEKEITLANGAILHTNGTIELARGKEKHLSPGKHLTLDGLYIAKDGRFLPVIDHYMIDGGKTTLILDGQSQPVQGEVKLENESKIMPAGWWVQPTGTRRRLLDGQRVDLQGNLIPSEDFVMNKAGQIVLQKDGALFTLDPTRVIAMSDGTRVMGNGQITRQDGAQLTLLPGQRLSLPGAR